MKKPRQTKTAIDITNAPASELLKLGFKPALVRKIIAARQSIIVPTGITDQTGQELYVEVSQEMNAAIQNAANARRCTVKDFVNSALDDALLEPWRAANIIKFRRKT